MPGPAMKSALARHPASKQPIPTALQMLGAPRFASNIRKRQQNGGSPGMSFPFQDCRHGQVPSVAPPSASMTSGMPQCTTIQR